MFMRDSGSCERLNPQFRHNSIRQKQGVLLRAIQKDKVEAMKADVGMPKDSNVAQSS